jgi:flagellum-specific ATP synthase
VDSLISQINLLPDKIVSGRVKAIRGLLVEIAGPLDHLAIGSRLDIHISEGRQVMVEVVGFDEAHALCLAFKNLEGVQKGALAELRDHSPYLFPHHNWLGRVINALGEPLDHQGDLLKGIYPMALHQPAPPAMQRRRLGPPVDLGVRALNTFVTCCEGQRMGIFAGSGVGKSVLLSMLARFTKADVIVLCLIGERGRELQEFLQDHLGIDGRKRAVVIAATSDESALMRKYAALTAMTVAEYFRRQGKNVFLMMDSLTRFAQAQREIGLAAGEPPTSKGYTPTVFSELPRLLERSGPGLEGEGMMTGLFTILVEGDDHNEPIADAVRAILDGHIVMERAIAEKGRFPAINVLKSVSRTMPECVPEDIRPVLLEARKYMRIYSDMEELIRLGAYRKGSDPDVDKAIALQNHFETFLGQKRDEVTSWKEGYDSLKNIMGRGAQPNLMEPPS